MKNQKKHIYISGKISGLQFEDVLVKFCAAEAMLRTLGYEVFNPLKHGLPHDSSWVIIMNYVLKVLLKCDEVFLLGDALESRGAKLEIKRAKAYGLKFRSTDKGIDEIIRSYNRMVPLDLRCKDYLLSKEIWEYREITNDIYYDYWRTQRLNYLSETCTKINELYPLANPFNILMGSWPLDEFLAAKSEELSSMIIKDDKNSAHYPVVNIEKDTNGDIRAIAHWK